MPEGARELIVFPTELSLRRFQQDEVLKHGWVDASGHTTFARLRKVCLPCARLKGKPLGPARELLLRRQAVEVAHGHFVDGGLLGELSPAALANVLQKLVAELAALLQPGTKRASAGTRGTEEHEQTLNQLLTEMDGFAPDAARRRCRLTVFVYSVPRGVLLC